MFECRGCGQGKAQRRMCCAISVPLVSVASSLVIAYLWPWGKNKDCAPLEQSTSFARPCRPRAPNIRCAVFLTEAGLCPAKTRLPNVKGAKHLVNLHRCHKGAPHLRALFMLCILLSRNYDSKSHNRAVSVSSH